MGSSSTSVSGRDWAKSGASWSSKSEKAEERVCSFSFRFCVSDVILEVDTSLNFQGMMVIESGSENNDQHLR